MRMKLSERVTRWMADKVIEQIITDIPQEATQAPQEPEKTGETAQSAPTPTWAPCDLYRVRTMPYGRTWVGSRVALERDVLPLSANEKLEQRWVAYDWRSVDLPSPTEPDLAEELRKHYTEPEQEPDALWDELRKHYTEPVLTEALALAEQAESNPTFDLFEAVEEPSPPKPKRKSTRRGRPPQILTDDRIETLHANPGEWVDLGRWGASAFLRLSKKHPEFEFRRKHWDTATKRGTIMARALPEADPRERVLTPTRRDWMREHPHTWLDVGRWDYSTFNRLRTRFAPRGYEMVAVDRRGHSTTIYARYVGKPVTYPKRTVPLATAPRGAAKCGAEVALSKAG